MTETQPEDAVAPTGSDRPARPVAHAWRRDIRLFSSAGDAPRSRRPTDVVLLALAVVAVPGGGGGDDDWSGYGLSFLDERVNDLWCYRED